MAELRTSVRILKFSGAAKMRAAGHRETGHTMRIQRRYTKADQSPYAEISFRLTTSEIRNPDGSVVFRADLADGGQGIYRWQQGEIATLAETGEQFAELGRFPCANASGTVAFAAVERSGHSGIFTPHFTVGGAFTFRGALIDDLNRVIAFATPIGGELGIYADGVRLIGVGDDFEGSTVAEFALNPVSINGAGQFAARLRLSDDRQFIVRFDDWATAS